MMKAEEKHMVVVIHVLLLIRLKELPSPPPSLTGFLSFFICITVSRLSLIASLLPRGSYR